MRLKSAAKAWDAVVDKMKLTWRSNGFSKDLKTEILDLRIVSCELAWFSIASVYFFIFSSIKQYVINAKIQNLVANRESGRR